MFIFRPKLAVCFGMCVCLFLLIPVTRMQGMAVPSSDDDRTMILRFERATVRFKLPTPFLDFEVQSFMFDSTLIFYGNDYEISLKKNGNISHKNANVNYESMLIEAGCGEGRAFSSTELSEFISNSSMEVNQAPIKVCKYNACLTTVISSDKGESTFTFNLQHPFFDFSGKSPLDKKDDLIRCLHSFAVYAYDPAMTVPTSRKVPKGIVAFGEAFLKDAKKAPLETGIIKDDAVEAQEDIMADDASSGTLYNMEVFEPDPDAAQPAIVQVKGDGERFAEDEVDGTAEIRIIVGGDTFQMDQVFYIEPDQEVKVSIATKGNEDARETVMKVPAGDAVRDFTEIVPSVDQKENVSFHKAFSITTGGCACAGTTYFDINTINQEPIDTILLDGQFDKLRQRCKQETTDFDERQARRGYLDMLSDQVRLMNQLINNLVKQTEESLVKLRQKTKDIQEALEDYEKDRKLAEDKTGYGIERQLENYQFDIRSASSTLGIYSSDYEKFLNFDHQIKAALGKSGLPPTATKADIDQKIGQLKKERDESLNGKILAGIKDQIRQLEEKIPETRRKIKDLQDDVKYGFKDREKGQSEIKSLQSNLQGWETDLENQKKRLKDYEEKLKFYEDIFRELETVKRSMDLRESYRASAQSYRGTFLKIKNLQDKYAAVFTEKYSAEEYIKVIDVLKDSAEKELTRTISDTLRLDSALQVFKKYIPKVKYYQEELTYLYGTLELKPTFGNLSQEYRSKQSTKALKSAISHIVRYGGYTFWDFRETDVLKISEAFVSGYLNGLNPFETVEFFQYTAYIIILHMVDEKLAKEEMSKVLGMGAEQIDQFFKMERFADQLKIIATIAGNAKGELAMAKAVGTGLGIAENKVRQLDEALGDAYAKYKLRQWPMENKNTMVDKLFSRTKNVDIELWDYSRQWMDKKIEKITTDPHTKFTAGQGERLKELITPLDLYYLSKPELAPKAINRMLRKSEAKYLLAKKTDPTAGRKKFWEEFYGLEDVNPGIAGQFDKTRDAIIFKHLEIARKMDPSMKFSITYTGSARGVSPDNLDAANLRKDRDLLFLGPDGPRAMAYFDRSIRSEYGTGWGKLFDADAYVDSKYDDIGRLIHNRKDLSPEVRIKAQEIWDRHRADINTALNDRIEKYKNETPLNNEKNPEELNQLLLQMTEYQKAWDTYQDLQALENYLRVNREYGLAMKDAYLTPGARKVEVELRGVWEKNFGLKSGEDWAKYTDAVNRGQIPGNQKEMPLVTAEDGLEVIRDNMKEVFNNSKKAMNPDEIATKASKYYERAIRSGTLVQDQINLHSVPLGGGKSVEDLRRLAMRIKEGKDLGYTRAEIMKYYGKDPQKPDMETVNRYLGDCKKAVGEIEILIQKQVSNPGISND